ncbi:MAG: patatin family protein [Hungatella hathewayi]|nr:patatin family protein [Hungatella hathewayi]
MIEGALVLEGGSLRSMFTSGVLDVMMEQGIELSYVNGVSAGSMCGMNYLSKQVGRTLQVNTEYLHDKRYMSFRNMLKNRLIFNFDFLFGELSTELVPFDFETFENSPQKFEVVATRCRTGQPVFFEKGVCTDMYAAVQASCSMPVLSRMITVEGRKYLDGGISLPIAYKRAMELGYEKVVVVLTRQHGYRKKPVDRLTKRGYDRYFEPLPELRAALEEVPERYNRMQEEMDELEADGKLFIIRPEFPVMVSRVEQDAEKLKALYAEGRRIGEEQLEALREYLGI